MDNIVLELVMILFVMLMMYVISFKYFIVHIFLAFCSIMVVLIDMTALSALFDDSLAGGIFWVGVVFYFMFMVAYKVLVYFDKIQ